jgi:MscS family membrane protein
MFAVASQWLVSSIPLSLWVRQFWTSAAGALAILAIVSLLIILNAEIERVFLQRLSRGAPSASAALLRVLRRVADVTYVVAGVGVMLRHFGIDPTPTLAGVGVGGIAVALAAQKTLENIVAGASLIFDQAVKVGDFLKVGEITGRVEHIGLRSTRMRTVDRTVVSIPNGHIAGATLETISARDKFWFHPEVRLRYETTPAQLYAFLERCRELLAAHPAVQREDQRVRFFRVAPYSLDVEIFAYVLVPDWDEFLRVQEQLLFGVTEAVERSGTTLALPSQTTYVEDATRQESISPTPLSGVVR